MNYKNLSLLLLLAIFPALVSAQKYLSTDMDEVSIEWKGQTFSSDKTLLENIADVAEFSIMADMLKQTSAEQAFKKEEMVTVFIVTDAAFSALDKDEREAILRNKSMWKQMVNYWTVPGRIDRNGLKVAAEKYGRTAYLSTLEGETLGIALDGDTLYLVDSEGRKATFSGTNFFHKDGLFHIVDAVVFPASYQN